MKVYNLCCEDGHRFEGWFSSEDDFMVQSQNTLIACPLCGNLTIRKLLSAPRLNLSGAQTPPQDGIEQQSQEMLLAIARAVIENTEDVGEQFADEARRIHYNEAPDRGIRGLATPDERAALADEGIEVAPFEIPIELKETLH
jgi:hypothetical protein